MPYRSTLRIVDGGACDGETPAAWIRPGDRAQTRCRLDERVHRVPGGHVDRRDAHLVPAVAQHLCRRDGVVHPQVGQQDMLPDADAPRNGLADLAGPDDNDDVCHEIPSWWKLSHSAHLPCPLRVIIRLRSRGVIDVEAARHHHESFLDHCRIGLSGTGGRGLAKD